MIRRARQLAAVALAVVVVLTAMAGAGTSPVGEVEAVDYAECGTWDKWAYVLSSPFGDWLKPECDPAALSDSYNELAESHEDAAETEIHSTGQQVQADSEQFLAVVGNYRMDSGTPAMADAEAAAIEEIDGGGTRAEVETAAEEAVQDYYAQRQINLIDHWNTQIETVWSMENTTHVSGLDETLVEGEGNTGTLDQGQINFVELHEPDRAQTIQLVDGNDYISYEIQRHVHADVGANSGATARIDSGHVSDQDTSGTGSGTSVDFEGVRVGAIEGQPGFLMFDFEDYSGEWSDIEQKSTQVEANAIEYAGALYNGTVEGNESTTDYVSGATMAEEFSTDHGETGFYSYAVGYGATQGLAIPDLQNTSLMEIQTASETYNGLLMSQDPPESGVWEVGTEYHTADINGTQFVATADGEILEIDGSFTIQSMQDADGNEVQETTSREVEYTVTNESADYSETQQELRDLRAEIEDMEPAPGGGGGGDGGFDFNLGGTGGIALIAALVGAALLLGRSN